MLKRRTYLTEDNVHVLLRSMHVIDLWTDDLSIDLLCIHESYKSILEALPITIRRCFIDDLPVLQLPFIVRDKKDSKSYPQWVVVWELVHKDQYGDLTTLVISKLFKMVEGVILEKELLESTPKINWSELSEEKIIVDDYDHFGGG